MLNIQSNKTVDFINVNSIKLPQVSKASPGKKRETLAEYVTRVRAESGLSLKEVEHRSGGRISSGYVSQIENSFALNPSTKKLRALAAVLRVSEDEMFAAARGTVEPEGFREGRLWELYEAIEEIDKKTHRQLVDEMLDGVIRTVRALPKKTPKAP